MYRVYDVTIRKEDSENAEKILVQHWNNGDIDDMRVHIQSKTLTYWINPYIYEDFETIKNEFKQAGIRII